MGDNGNHHHNQGEFRIAPFLNNSTSAIDHLSENPNAQLPELLAFFVEDNYPSCLTEQTKASIHEAFSALKRVLPEEIDIDDPEYNVMINLVLQNLYTTITDCINQISAHQPFANKTLTKSLKLVFPPNTSSKTVCFISPDTIYLDQLLFNTDSTRHSEIFWEYAGYINDRLISISFVNYLGYTLQLHLNSISNRNASEKPSEIEW